MSDMNPQDKLNGTEQSPSPVSTNPQDTNPIEPPKGYDSNHFSGQENVSNAADGTPEKKEHTRSKMAILFVLGFFAILFLCFVYAIMIGAGLDDLKDTLVGVIGALSGILGFIVGYYYKSSMEQ